MEDEKQQTFEEILEMQRVVAANRGRMIDGLLGSRVNAISDCEQKVAQINATLRELGYKKTRQPRAASGTVGAEPAKKRTRKKAA